MIMHTESSPNQDLLLRNRFIFRDYACAIGSEHSQLGSGLAGKQMEGRRLKREARGTGCMSRDDKKRDCRNVMHGGIERAMYVCTYSYLCIYVAMYKRKATGMYKVKHQCTRS